MPEARRSTGIRPRRRTRPSRCRPAAGSAASRSISSHWRRVRVLELVDHDRAEPELLRLADPLVDREEVAREQLEVLEVERRLALLRAPGTRRRTGRAAPGAGRGRAAAASSSAACSTRLARVLEARRARAVRAQRREVDQRLGQRREVESGPRRGQMRSVAPGSSSRHAAGSRSASALRGRRRLARARAVERPPRGAQRLVDAGQHLAQPDAAVGGEQPVAPRRAFARRPSSAREKASPRSTAPCSSSSSWKPGSIPTENGCARRSLAQKPWIVEIHAPSSSAGQVGPAAVDERGPDARAELAGGLAGVGDDEHRLDVETLVADRADEPLDEHGRLPGPGSRRDEHLAACLDAACCSAFIVASALLTRHIVQRSHHVGHSPPFGSCATSPAADPPRGVERALPADSTWPQNCSSSR